MIYIIITIRQNVNCSLYVTYIYIYIYIYIYDDNIRFIGTKIGSYTTLYIDRVYIYTPSLVREGNNNNKIIIIR